MGIESHYQSGAKRSGRARRFRGLLAPSRIFPLDSIVPHGERMITLRSFPYHGNFNRQSAILETGGIDDEQ
jgi:hypothetical protein